MPSLEERIAALERTQAESSARQSIEEILARYARAIDRLDLELLKSVFHPDGVIILPRIPTQCLKGSVPRLARPVSLKQMDKANKAEAAARFQRA